MKAHELYRVDQVDGNELSRDPGRPRRQYYLDMRQSLREECATGLPCPLLEAFAARMKENALPHLYLLDAAALWECYEGVIEGTRYTRDIGVGLPFLVAGRTLKWNDVERMSTQGTLPVAVMDTELQNRLTALVNHTAKGKTAERPPVNLRASISTADPRDAAPAAPAQPRAAQADPEQLRQLEALRQENSNLLRQLEQLRQNQDMTREYAVRAADSYLAGRTEEARALALQLDGALQSAAAELAQTAAECRTLQESLDRTQEELQADRLQIDALCRQQQQAEQSLTLARTERERQQQQTLAALGEQQAAQAELDEAAARLQEALTTLRALRQKTARTREACEATQRQIGALT